MKKIILPLLLASACAGAVHAAPQAIRQDDLRARLNALPESYGRAKALCWLDLSGSEKRQSFFHRNGTPRTAQENAAALADALERGRQDAALPADKLIYARVVLPSADPNLGRPKWRADILKINQAVDDYKQTQCFTPLRGCLEVAQASVRENMDETDGAIVPHGRPEIDHALSLVERADTDIRMCQQARMSMPIPELPAAIPAAPIAPAVTLIGEPPVVTASTLAADAFFDFDRAVIKPKGRDALAALAQDIKAKREVTAVEVTGHTDRFGSDDHNQRLSEKRAQAVADFLKALGVAVPIQIRGVGGAKPVIMCEGPANAKTIACLEPNRRVSVMVSGYD